MIRRRSMTRSLAIVGFVLLIVAKGYAHAGDCQDDDVRNAIVGGTIGVATGVVTLAAIQGATIGLAAGAGGTVLATLTTDCAFALCIPVVTTLAAVGSVVWWLLNADYDCAGAIAISEKSHGFYRVWNRNSTRRAYNYSKEFCEEYSGESCKVLGLFRHCAAVARDSTKDVFGIGAGRTSYEADKAH